MSGVTIQIRDEHVRSLLRDLRQRFDAREEVMESIGAALVSTTQQRFLDERGPDGKPWAPLATNTILSRLPKQLTGKRGRVTKRALTAAEGLKILRRKGLLYNSVTYNASNDGVKVGSNKVQAALLQFGGTADMPAGPRAVPARPYLGLSDADEVMIGDVVASFFAAVQ